MREDYEPYEIKSNGKTYWCFDVEYYGHYICQSKEELVAEIKRVKKEVASVVKDIEKQNEVYYEQLAKQEELLLAQLREAWERKQRVDKQIQEHKTKQQIWSEREQIREYIRRGYSNGKILLLMPESSRRTISHVRLWHERKEAQKNSADKKQSENSPENKIIFPWWSSL